MEGETVAEIGRGLVLLVGVGHDDGLAEAEWLAEKCAGLRIFEDDQGKMNLSIGDVGGQALVVSQFTLYADAGKGRRPSFIGAARQKERRRWSRPWPKACADTASTSGRVDLGRTCWWKLKTTGRSRSCLKRTARSRGQW